MKGKAIQICGTGSGVGKSVLVAGLCRIFLRDGHSVAPFKAQNMALNSFVTKEAGEIGRAQAVQAQASKIEPSVDMNPVLIKPTSDVGAQVIVRGKPVGNMTALEYRDAKAGLVKTVRESFDRLINEYEIVVIEGAGSPAEINLKADDIVNMKMAEYADAPVILVGDIDKGGVFAWIVGTLELLTETERARVKGIIINKFRGDKSLLASGIDFLERRTGIKVLGVVPYFKDIKIQEEDSVCLEKPNPESRIPNPELLNIAIIHLPHISNFTDFDALEKEPDVRLYYVKSAEELKNADIIIIPGTKNTIADLDYLKKSGLADKIFSSFSSSLSSILVGICGGYQMLGTAIYDKHSIESSHKSIEGLGFLPVETEMEKEKVLTQVKARELGLGIEVSGYEIHNGSTRVLKKCKPAFKVIERNGKEAVYPDGAIGEEGRIWGTYIHGIFDSDVFRREFLNRARLKKGWTPLAQVESFDSDKEFDKLAGLLRENVDMEQVYKMLK